MDAAAAAAADGAAAGAATAASPGGAAAAAAGGAPPSPTPAAAAVPALPREEVIRRMRALGQPVTLFGEEDADRQARLAKVEKTVALVDETRGGQQENVMLMLKRQEKAKAKQAAGDKAAAGGTDKAAGGRAAAAASGGGAGEGPAKPSKAAEGGAAAADADAGHGSGAAGSGGGGDTLLDSFKAAAVRVAEQRTEDALPVEDRMVKLIQGWCAEWEADLEARPEEVSERDACVARIQPAQQCVGCSSKSATQLQQRPGTVQQHFLRSPFCTHTHTLLAILQGAPTGCWGSRTLPHTCRLVDAMHACCLAAGQDVWCWSPGHAGVQAEHDLL